MKSTLAKLILGIFAIVSLLAVAWAQSQSRAALGKIDFQGLFDATPAPPATPADAGKRAYGSDFKAQDPKELDTFYAPFNQRAAAARGMISGAVANRGQDNDALAQRTIAQANASPIISRMGGIEKMGQMSEAELQQAAIQAAGAYQQSLAGAPSGAGGGGMQAMMQRLMSDPAYQARFEKMSKAQQEAELQKYMGNPMAAAPAGPTAAERQAKQATVETTSVLAKQKELGALMQKLGEIDAEFARKDEAIFAAPGGHKEISQDVRARIERVPMIKMGEAGDIRDPAKMQPLERELVTRDRARAASELQQQSALYTQRKARYKEVATAYANWLRQGLGGVNSQTAQLLDDATVQVAVQCEQKLIEASENLAKYSSDATRNAALYESSYQTKMSERLIK